ncbi:MULTISPECIES: YuzF family protein [Alkalihalobacterium]|uniref:YuzF family protein n=1 Tax=Alkalihalobacterium chitinilyticum TaxID=2980103 RepID=A0ABT5VBF5_9BACI|nr:YuzF family protein [Alkalihalobacterium chitinilyticum]MDE5412778.1 YuzF family protein [Alkalihalobacterium chitinilyticum]MEB1809432.1 YuzF family protein [Bacillaceae bacterium]
MNHHQGHQHGHASAPQMISLVDPYVYQTLQTIIGRTVVVQTAQGNIRGALTDVKPDHVVVDVAGSPFFIRTQSIIWVLPQ